MSRASLEAAAKIDGLEVVGLADLESSRAEASASGRSSPCRRAKSTLSRERAPHRPLRCLGGDRRGHQRACRFFSGEFPGVPVQMFWALGFVCFAALLFDRHRFGARVHCVGDNPDSAAQMGINVNRLRIATFVFMGLGAGLAGVFSTMINFTWWPTTGDGYLLPAIASVFVGGTPTWGGIGTIAGGAIGALIVSFIQSGIVAASLSGFYVQFFNGLIIILALLGHRWNQKRYR
jgi:ribose/xylose/arabinose/galactoside ABC-type transport system permease subunit